MTPKEVYEAGNHIERVRDLTDARMRLEADGKFELRTAYPKDVATAATSVTVIVGQTLIASEPMFADLLPRVKALFQGEIDAAKERLNKLGVSI